MMGGSRCRATQARASAESCWTAGAQAKGERPRGERRKHRAGESESNDGDQRGYATATASAHAIYSATA